MYFIIIFSLSFYFIQEATLFMSEDIFLLWNASLHMTVLTVVHEGVTFKNNMQNCCRDDIGKKHIKENSEESNVCLFYLITF